MRKIQILGVALVAMFAFSAIVASMASAEVTLLAEWLIAGKAVTATTATKTTGGEIFLEDKTFGAGVTCAGIFDGNVGPNGVDETTEVLSTAGVLVSLAAPLTLTTGCKINSGCETAGGVEVAPEELPWKTLLYLVEATGKFRDIATKAGYAVTCRLLGLKLTDTCTVEKGSFEVLAETAGAEATGAITPKGNCSVGGKESGVEEFKGVNHLQNSAAEGVVPSE